MEDAGRAAMPDRDCSAELGEQVRAALAARRPLRISAGGSKAFYGRPGTGDVLDVRGHRGIVRYDPSELVVTARAGTTVAELMATLDEAGQMLAFEAPAFAGKATVGGMVAAGLSGPRRPWAGAVRDFVLGSRLLSGTGEHLRFGGEVMKNVAGYDVSRLLAGSLGCLGVITEVSLKVLPRPRASCSLSLELGLEDALCSLAEWGLQALPLTAACHDGQVLRLRLEGGASSVAAARKQLGGEEFDAGWWQALREYSLDFFRSPLPLWRLSVAPDSRPQLPDGEQLADWAGAQRWLKSAAPAEEIRAAAEAAGGHASCFTAGICDSPFHPLPPALMRYHRQLKVRLDPQGIFNPGRMYAEL